MANETLKMFNTETVATVFDTEYPRVLEHRLLCSVVEDVNSR